MINIGARLKHIRESLHQDQAQFAVSIGVSSRNTVYRWEKGSAYPPADVLQIIHQKYAINLHWLITGEGNPFIREGEESDKTTEAGKVVAIDAAVQLLREAEEETGITLNPAQRQAVLPILRKSLAEDRRTVKELIRSMFGGKKNEGSG